MDDTASKVVIPLLNELIDDGFNKAEISADQQQILAQLKRLTKSRLIDIYNQLVVENTTITKWNSLLNKNTYKYFTRKKNSQSVIKDNPEEVTKLEEKYKQRLAELGEIISKHEKVRVDQSSRLRDLQYNRDELYRIHQEGVTEFENIMQETAKPLKSFSSGQKLSPEALDSVIAQIRASRKQMSEARLHFIKTLDRHTQMDVKAIKLQDLGNGLRMNDFSQLREERQLLEEKIEARNNTLEKLRLRCFSETQILSHVREKKFVLEGTEEDENEELKFVLSEMKITRNFMNSCNAKCEKLRKTYAELSTNCGLLDKPDLLRDFDETELKFKRKKNSVEGLRQEIDDINKKIVDLTQAMNTARHLPKSNQRIHIDNSGNTKKKTIRFSQSVLQIQ